MYFDVPLDITCLLLAIQNGEFDVGDHSLLEIEVDFYHLLLRLADENYLALFFGDFSSHGLKLVINYYNLDGLHQEQIFFKGLKKVKNKICLDFFLI